MGRGPSFLALISFYGDEKDPFVIIIAPFKINNNEKNSFKAENINFRLNK